MDELLDSGSSVYHRFVGLAVRGLDGSLIFCSGPAKQQIVDNWESLRQHHIVSKSSQPGPQSTRFNLPFSLPDKDAESESNDTPKVLLVEQLSDDKSYVLGIVVEADSRSAAQSTDEFFLGLVLQSLQTVDTSATKSDGDPDNTLANKVTDLFDETLRYVSSQDQWTAKGREYFVNRVAHYTRQGVKIELCLPAFPCKSSNPDKVGGRDPDRGEYIALNTLHDFVDNVEKVYPPGAKVWIISDGHVFSDCIGVDDSEVDVYGEHLRHMNETITTERGGEQGRVCFQGLVELLKLADEDIKGQALANKLDLPTINHYIEDVKIGDDADTCRRILMSGFKASTTKLRARIDGKDPSILALYRGFSRFMLEDLEKNEYTEKLSKSQRRKLSSKVAFEMIERNQAYSNLVELVFPHHVRLSIHAHNNAGPKFGIQLMGPNVRATNKLSTDGDVATSHDLLHVPTPWHGCIVEIEGHDDLYMTKAHVVKEALDGDELDGEWLEGDDIDQLAEEDSRGRAGSTRNPTGTHTRESSVKPAFFHLRPASTTGSRVPSPNRNSTSSRVGSVPASESSSKDRKSSAGHLERVLSSSDEEGGNKSTPPTSDDDSSPPPPATKSQQKESQPPVQHPNHPPAPPTIPAAALPPAKPVRAWSESFGWWTRPFTLCVQGRRKTSQVGDRLSLTVAPATTNTPTQ